MAIPKFHRTVGIAAIAGIITGILAFGQAWADSDKPFRQDLDLGTASKHHAGDDATPPQDPTDKAGSGRELFIVKGCIACHAVNGIGGDQAKALGPDTLGEQATPYDVAARMWNSARRMLSAQRMLFGHTLEMTGKELEMLSIFLTDRKAQAELTQQDLRSAMNSVSERARAGIPRSRW